VVSLADIWNEVAGKTKLDPVVPPDKWPASLKRKLRLRLREHGEEAVEKVLTAPLRSPFLAGDNDRGWTCDLDWLLGPRNFVKVKSGKYENSGSRPTGVPKFATASRRSDWEGVPTGILTKDQVRRVLYPEED